MQRFVRRMAIRFTTAMPIVAATVLAPPFGPAGALTADRRLDRRLAEPPISVQEPQGIFRGVGVVTAIDPRTGALTLDHEDIKGFMPAMTMMYRVASPSLSDGLRPGDAIEFDIDVKAYTITRVKLIERKK